MTFQLITLERKKKKNGKLIILGVHYIRAFKKSAFRIFVEFNIKIHF